MKTKKIITVALVVALALTNLVAVTTTEKGEYKLKANSPEKSFGSEWFFGDALLDTTTNIVKTDGSTFDLSEENEQTSKDFVLKTSDPVNLPSNLLVTISITATSFYAVDSSGVKLTGDAAFDTAETVTSTNYSFKANPIVPSVNFENYITGTSGSVGVTYDSENSVTILKGFHEKGVLLNKFSLSFTGNRNVLSGSYQSDLTFSVTYGG